MQTGPIDAVDAIVLRGVVFIRLRAVIVGAGRLELGSLPLSVLALPDRDLFGALEVVGHAGLMIRDVASDLHEVGAARRIDAERRDLRAAEAAVLGRDRALIAEVADLD